MQLAALPEPQRAAVLASLPDETALALRYDWSFLARDTQLPPTDDTWTCWLILAGRGFGKTRTGAEWVIDQARAGGKGLRIALVAATAADARDTMVEGESGILACSPPWFRPFYQSSKRRLIWPNGAIATTYSADVPDRLRGPQHHRAWADELCAWLYPETWDQLMFGLRLGQRPQVVVTTTPRPTRQLAELMAASTTRVTRGSTFENSANLAPAFLEKVVARYEGTRLGRQELHAEILEDTPGALWTRRQLDDLRVRETPELTRVVVSVDPSTADDGAHAECGIVGVGLGIDGIAYVLRDVSAHLSPDAWARISVALYHDLRADVLVAEANQGGALVRVTVGTVKGAPQVKLVYASRGKYTRAEPVAALYEQRKVRHVGAHAALEDEMTSWAGLRGERSPNRVDALVWGLTELCLGSPSATLADRSRLHAPRPRL